VWPWPLTFWNQNESWTREPAHHYLHKFWWPKIQSFSTYRASQKTSWIASLGGRPPRYASVPCKLTISSYLFARWHLFRHVGYLRHQQQVDLWPFDLESDVRVTCDVGYLCTNFSLPRPLCSRVTPDVRDRRQIDRRQTKASLNASALRWPRHNKALYCYGHSSNTDN